MTLGPLRPSPLVEQAAVRLRARITDGTWPIGSKLPGETTLAAELGVGRSTVREALRSLAGAGLLRPRQGAGVFVIAAEPAADWSVRLRHAAVIEVYEVRAMIETQAAKLAAERRTQQDLEAMDAALANRRRVGTDAEASTEAFVDADLAVHRAVVAASQNSVVLDLYDQFLPILREALIDLVRLLGIRDQDPNPGHASHSALVEAVRDGDAGEAERVARAEIDTTANLLKGAA